MSTELIQNGDFSSSQYWLYQNLWSVSAGKGRYLKSAAGGQDESLAQNIALEPGKTCRLRLTVELLAISAGATFKISVGGWNAEDIVEAGIYNLSFTAQTTGPLKFEVTGNPQDGDEVILDNVSLIDQPQLESPYATKTYTTANKTIKKIIPAAEYQR